MNMGASHLQQFISAVIQAKKKKHLRTPGRSAHGAQGS